MSGELKFPAGPGGTRRGVTLTAEQREQLRLQGNAPAGGRVQKIPLDVDVPARPPIDPDVRRLTSSRDDDAIETASAFLAAVESGGWDGILAAFGAMQDANRGPAQLLFSDYLDRALSVLASRRREAADG